jgi:hypothetical protein
MYNRRRSRRQKGNLGSKQITLMASRAIGAIGRLAFPLVAFLPLIAMAQESGSVCGRVVDEAGKAIPFAVVNALRLGAPNKSHPESPIVAAGSAVNLRGEYCLRELTSGAYLVRATARTHPPSASLSCDSCCGSNTEFEITFYRSPPAIWSPSPVFVRKGRNPSGVDIRMRRVPAYCVHGEVRDAEGSLVSHAVIGVEQGSWSAGVLNEGGRFLLTSLPSGAYSILIFDWPQLGRVLVRRTFKIGAANIDGLVVTIGSSAWPPSPSIR